MGVKKKILDALDRFLLILREKTLQTLEEIEANTSGGYWAGADAVDALNNKLMFPSGTEFYLDEHDGERGYNTDPARGADTFHPFKQKPKIILIGSGNTAAAKTFSATSIKGYNKLTSDNFFLRASIAAGAGGGSSSGSYGISYNPASGIVTVNQYVVGVTAWDRPFQSYLSYQVYAYV